MLKVHLTSVDHVPVHVLRKVAAVREGLAVTLAITLAKPLPEELPHHHQQYHLNYVYSINLTIIQFFFFVIV